MENLDKDNIKASIQISTDGAVTIGETRGYYKDLMFLVGQVIYGFHEETGIGLDKIGADLNKVVEEIVKNKAQEA